MTPSAFDFNGAVDGPMLRFEKQGAAARTSDHLHLFTGPGSVTVAPLGRAGGVAIKSIGRLTGQPPSKARGLGVSSPGPSLLNEAVFRILKI